MRAKALVAGFIINALAPAAWAANPVGHYIIEGRNPGGGGTYTGTVDITRTGETYNVVWMIGSKRTIGTAIGNKTFLAISYKSGNESGLALYGAQGDDWAGAWTYAGGTTLGDEHWVRE